MEFKSSHKQMGAGDAAKADYKKLSRLDRMITELESSEGNTTSILRSVYADKEDSTFMKKLEAKITAQDKEIEKMCHRHYQGFIDAVRELLQVKDQSEHVKESISTTQMGLETSSGVVVDKAQELIRRRQEHLNACQAISALEVALPALEMYSKLLEQMAAKRYYPALKTLEQLEHTYMPRITTRNFQPMRDEIPKIRDKIKESSTSDLKDFLETIRRQCVRVGEAAMIQMCLKNKMDVSLAVVQKKKTAVNNPFTSNVSHMMTSSITADDEQETSSPQDLVDYSAVYRCIHINSVLGAKDDFESYYRKQRRQQCRLVLDPPSNMGDNVDAYKTYFHNIIGFFICEEHILNTTSGLVTRGYIDDLWDRHAVDKIVNQLKQYSAYLTDAPTTLTIKNIIILFSLTMKGYGFNTQSLNQLLLLIYDQYMEILMQSWVNYFKEIFQDDDYTAILVNDEEEYYYIVKNFPYIDERLERAKFPKRFPFSQMVPRVYGHCRKYIFSCLKYCESLNLSNTEIDDLMRKSTNVLLSRTLSGSVTLLLRQPSLSLLQLIQIAVNMNYLEKSCDYLEEFISATTGAEKDSVTSCRIHGTAMFKDARNEAEERIYLQINHRVDEFFELAEYDWYSIKVPLKPSDYIHDLLDFLTSTFSSFSHLPYKLAQTACMSVCKHIADEIKQLILDDGVKHIEIGTIQQLSLDVQLCETFAASEPVPGMSADGTLQLAFVEMRQLTDLLSSRDWSTYLADYGQQSNKYSRVKPSDLSLMLEKMKSGGKRGGNFLDNLARRNPEREQQQLLETVIKRLKTLQP